MKRLVSVLCVIILFICLLSGCAADDKPASVADETFLAESTMRIPDDAFSFSGSEYEKIKFQSYLHEHGTSSVNSSILVYRYEDTLIFAVSYFQGALSAMETFVLNQDQGQAFLAMVDACKKAKDTTSLLNRNTMGMGSSYTKYILNNGSKDVSIEPLPLAELDLTLSTEEELLFDSGNPFAMPSSEGKNVYPAELEVGHSFPALYNCINQQALVIFGSLIAEITQIQAGPIDAVMDVSLEDGSNHKILVTNSGYVVSYS